jgi:glycosyltransferase involved in cell wall biosynthesis
VPPAPEGKASKGKLLFVVTEDWYFLLHWKSLALAAQASGFDVVVATRDGPQFPLIGRAGLRAIPFAMDRRGLSPWGLAREFLALRKLVLAEQPELLHLIALRPVVVGSVLARWLGHMGVVSAITGLGYLFTGPRRSLARRVLELALPVLLSRGVTITQNPSDQSELADLGVDTRRLESLPGVGVDTDEYSPRLLVDNTAQDPGADRPLVVFLAARLLWEKGVGEYVEAARLVLAAHPSLKVRFLLAGAADPGNPGAIAPEQIEAWRAQAPVEWLGYRDDMPDLVAACDICCLPSYREGMPRTVQEAMACGKPCVVTDVTGCRDAVRDGDNGLLVPPRDAPALAQALARLLLDADLRQRMGRRGRERAVAEFSAQVVNQATIGIYHRVLALARKSPG